MALAQALSRYGPMLAAALIALVAYGLYSENPVNPFHQLAHLPVLKSVLIFHGGATANTNLPQLTHQGDDACCQNKVWLSPGAVL